MQEKKKNFRRKLKNPRQFVDFFTRIFYTFYIHRVSIDYRKETIREPKISKAFFRRSLPYKHRYV